jgi:transcriptional regulator with XRE-family HTH domain
MTIAQILKEARAGKGLGLRELARQSGVSPSQVSRIESGEVAQPSADTLISLSRALDRNPAPLLIVSRHIDEREAQAILWEMFRPNAGEEYDPLKDSELVDEWEHLGRKREVAVARRLLNDYAPPADQLRELAAQVFLTAETAETLWRDSFVESLARRAEDDDLLQLIALWQTLPHVRRAKLLDYASEQADLELAKSKEKEATER